MVMKHNDPMSSIALTGPGGRRKLKELIKKQSEHPIIRPAYAKAVVYDAEALGQLAGHVERGTIFDVLVEKATDDTDGLTRVLNVGGEFPYLFLYLFSAPDASVMPLQIEYNPTQYSGLAAVQKAVGATTEIPELATNDDFLIETTEGRFICVGDKFVSATKDDDDKAIAFAITDTSPTAGTDYINISADDLQKLIGLPIL